MDIMEKRRLLHSRCDVWLPWNLHDGLVVHALAVAALEASVATLAEEARGGVEALAARGLAAGVLATRAVLTGRARLVADGSVGALLHGVNAEVHGSLILGGRGLQQAHDGDDGSGEDSGELHGAIEVGKLLVKRRIRK
ncbi:hypothetical protein V7S43_015204 [Phytophthora oleae]|uniref:Uncharacterized protein n=1 Tax=Phytophthora oleae TaxID=2107226 RepID=A0ABD3EZM1_9STRA